MTRRFLLLIASSFRTMRAADYDGPKPPKPDFPYLKQSGRLIETELKEARQEDKKGDTTYVIDGDSSTAKTPLAEPVFIIDAQTIAADRMEMYKLEVRNGRREVTLSQKRRKGGPKPIHLLVTKLGGSLFKIEADEHLDNGQYSLSPNDSNRVFCFEVY